jgi:hypothetical protein
MIKLTETREITPYSWTHPDDDDRRIGPTNHERPLSGKPDSAVALPKRCE